MKILNLKAIIKFYTSFLHNQSKKTQRSQNKSMKLSANKNYKA